MADTSKKIIRGIVNSRGFTITSAITQWDYGWQFIPEIEDLPATYRLDFSNEEKHGAALPVYCSTEGAEVPTELIDTGKDVWVWFVRIGDGYGITEYKWRIPNKCKPKTEQDEPTPAQQSSIDQAISALNEAVAQTAQDVINADASAQSAQGYAEQAETAKTNAQTYANNAQTSATSAQTSASQASASATASAQSASQAEQIKTDVEGLIDDAQASANASERSASNAYTYATSAERSSVNASASAQSASGYASNAQTSANAASAKAQDASTSAQTASTKATESAQSASQALTYKTDAESAKTASQTAQGLAESARDTAVQAKEDAESARDTTQTLVDEITEKVEQIDANTDAIESLDDDRYKPYATDTASGAIASFSDGADDLPLKSLVIDINSVQDLHGQDAPYPAGGGKNKFDGEPRTIVPLRLTSGVAYSASCDKTTSGGYTVLRVYDVTQAQIGSYTLSNISGNRYGRSFTLTEDASYVNFDTDSSSTVITNMQIEQSSSPTDYAPYENICPISGWTQTTVNHSDADMTNPTTLTISLGQIVYGGKLNVLSGKLTIDRAMVDLGTLSWARQPYEDKIDSYFSADIANSVSRNTASLVVLDLISSMYSANSDPVYGRTKDNKMCVLASTGALYISASGYASAKDFKTAMDGVQLCYPLAEPIEIQLTPQQVNSLLGVNNIWADTGDTEVVYRADTKAYIAKKIAEAISALS